MLRYLWHLPKCLAKIETGSYFLWPVQVTHNFLSSCVEICEQYLAALTKTYWTFVCSKYLQLGTRLIVCFIFQFTWMFRFSCFKIMHDYSVWPLLDLHSQPLLAKSLPSVPSQAIYRTSQTTSKFKTSHLGLSSYTRIQVLRCWFLLCYLQTWKKIVFTKSSNCQFVKLQILLNQFHLGCIQE